MKRSKSCYGLLLVLSIIFGFSLSVCSGDTSALKHSVTEMPFGLNRYSFPDGSSFQSREFQISWKEAYNPSYDSSQFNFPRFIPISYNDSSHKCVFGSSGYNFNSDSYSFYPSSNLSLSASLDNYLSPFTSEFISNSSSYCQRFYKFGSPSSQLPSSSVFPMLNTAMPEFDTNSFPGSYPGLANMKNYNFAHSVVQSGYWYNFNSAAFADKYINTDSGLHYSSSLSFSDLLGFAPDKFSDLSIPLGYVISDEQPSDFGSLSYGRPVTFKGVFDFGSSPVTWGPGAISSGSFKLYGYGVSSSSSNTISVSCTANNYFITDIVNNSFSQLEYTCPLVLDQDYDYMSFALVISSGSGDYIWDLGGHDLSFAGQWVITDNDETPGSNFSVPCSGSDCNLRPGSAYLDYLNDSSSDPGVSVDWFSSLVSLFTFGFLNPFAPLFQLFSDNNSCANIPTLAGMIHSESTVVCPWFDSSVRNIVTPVLGISSVMLIFGFAVRWLGSSSGNLFEDSSNEVISNQGGHWGRFKKGG